MNVKRLLQKALLLSAIHFTCACGASSILLIHLKTNDLKYCPVDEKSDACIRELESRGYIRAEQLTPGQKASLGVVLPY